MRSEGEIRAELARLEAYPRGSYEEMAGAEGTLRWVLGEEDFTVVDWSEVEFSYIVTNPVSGEPIVVSPPYDDA